MVNKEPGYVYILTNPSFREDWVKIGKSSRPVDVRSKELDNTAVSILQVPLVNFMETTGGVNLCGTGIYCKAIRELSGVSMC